MEGGGLSGFPRGLVAFVGMMASIHFSIASSFLYRHFCGNQEIIVVRCGKPSSNKIHASVNRVRRQPL
jgi:hypothetical protein